MSKNLNLPTTAPMGFAPVTAVIPCYRDAATIHRAVSSAVQQTMPPREIIVVDDGSDHDTTEHILRSIEAEFPGRVSVVRLERNAGPAVARNCGWDAASQPFVAFLDADDVWHPQKIALQLPLMLAPNGAGIAGHGIRIGPPTDSYSDSYARARVTTVTMWKLLRRNWLPTPTVMVKASLTHRFDPTRRYCEDYDLWLRIVASGEPCKFLPMPLSSTFKDSFGEKGLSNNLWRMELAQADVYRGLRADELISRAHYCLLIVWGAIRFVRRLAISGSRRLRRRLRG